MTEENCLQVDLERVIRDKNPSLARWLPRPLLSYLKRTIHQDEINRILKSYSHLDPIGFIRATLADMRIGYRSQGLDRLPADGRYLFVSNHPFGGMDGMMLCAELSTRFSEVRIIVNDLLMNLRPLAPLFVPVNKHGRQNARYAQTLRDTLESNAQIATFPAGLCSRRHHGRVADPRWKHSFVKNALREPPRHRAGPLRRRAVVVFLQPVEPALGPRYPGQYRDALPARRNVPPERPAFRDPVRRARPVAEPSRRAGQSMGPDGYATWYTGWGANSQKSMASGGFWNCFYKFAPN